MERAISGLGPHLCLADLEHPHIQILAPLVLGEAVWDLYANTYFADWTEFKSVITRRFGLTKA